MSGNGQFTIPQYKKWESPRWKERLSASSPTLLKSQVDARLLAVSISRAFKKTKPVAFPTSNKSFEVQDLSANWSRGKSYIYFVENLEVEAHYLEVEAQQSYVHAAAAGLEEVEFKKIFFIMLC